MESSHRAGEDSYYFLLLHVRARVSAHATGTITLRLAIIRLYFLGRLSRHMMHAAGYRLSA